MNATTKTIDLSHFNGSENFHRTTLNRRFICTDGIKYLADEAGAYWLIDLAASHQSARLDRVCEGFQVWTLRKLPPGCKNMAVAECRRDKDAPHAVRQLIEFTDFPFEATGGETFKFYVAGSRDDGWTMMLTSEY